jgi:hypothetical protein
MQDEDGGYASYKLALFVPFPAFCGWNMFDVEFIEKANSVLM